MDFTIDSGTYDDIEVIDLNIGDTTDELVTEVTNEVEKPCFILDNIMFDEELDLFLEQEESTERLPVYFSDGITTDKLGYMEPTTEKIIVTRFLKIDIKFINTAGNIRDFSHIGDYIGFIHI